MGAETGQSLPEWLERCLVLRRDRMRTRIEVYMGSFAEAYQNAVRKHAANLNEAMADGKFPTCREWHPLYFGEAGKQAVEHLLPPAFREPRWSFTLKDLSDLIQVDTSRQPHPFAASEVCPLRLPDQDLCLHLRRWERKVRSRVRLKLSIVLAVGGIVGVLGAVAALMDFLRGCA